MSKSITDEMVDILPDTGDLVISIVNGVLVHTNNKVFYPINGDIICKGDKVIGSGVNIINGEKVKVHLTYESPKDGSKKKSYNNEYHLKGLKLLRKEKLKKINKSNP